MSSSCETTNSDRCSGCRCMITLTNSQRQVQSSNGWSSGWFRTRLLWQSNIVSIYTTIFRQRIKFSYPVNVFRRREARADGVPSPPRCAKVFSLPPFHRAKGSTRGVRRPALRARARLDLDGGPTACVGPSDDVGGSQLSGQPGHSTNRPLSVARKQRRALVSPH